MLSTTFYYFNNQLMEIIATKQLVIQKKWSIKKIDLTVSKRNEVNSTLNSKLDDLHHKRSRIQKKIRKTFLKRMYYSDNETKLVSYIKRGRKLRQKSKRLNLYISKVETMIKSVVNMSYITEKGKLIGESKYYPAKERNIRNTKRILELQKKEQELKNQEQVEYIPIEYTDYMMINPQSIFDLGKAKPQVIGRIQPLSLIKRLDYA